MNSEVTRDEIAALGQKIDRVLALLEKPTDMEAPLTKSEAAEFLKVSLSKFERLENAGKVRRIPDAGHPRYRRADLLSYLRTGSTGVQYKQPRIRRKAA